MVEPASANIYQNPTTNQYVDADITAKQVSITVPGTAFNRTDNRYIEIKQGDTIRKAKTLIGGSAVTEDYWNQQTTMTFTEDFSGYTKDVDAVVSIYLTDTATKPVATATINVVEMPFKLVFFKTDHLGTPRMVTDHDGTILTTHDFLAYGEELTDPDFNTNRMKFTGHERDPETGLDYMKARYYGAGVGRFLQVDPGYDYDQADPMSFNLYGYVRGNPVVGTDPKGKELYYYGDTETLAAEHAKQMAGEFADKVSVGENGQVTFDVTAEDVAGNDSAKALLEMTTCEEKMGLYLGTDADMAASFFEDGPGPILSREGLAKEFNGVDPTNKWGTKYGSGGGRIIGTVGRPKKATPANGFFAFIALNKNATLTQKRSENQAQQGRDGNLVSRGQFWLHETVENLSFIRQARATSGVLDFEEAHGYAVNFEILHSPPASGGGFAGSILDVKVK